MNKNCSYPNCYNIAIYGINNDINKPYWCEEHIEEISQNDIKIFIKSNKRLCRNKDCNKKASFNFPLKKNKIFCAEHKYEGMINLYVTKKCLGFNKQCNSIPSYGLKEDNLKKALYCSKCYNLLPDKENYIDVIHRKCEDLNCNKTPVFGYINEKPRFCKIHCLENMINIKDSKCIFETLDEDNMITTCQKIGTYRDIHDKNKLYCYKHSIMKGNCEDFVHKKCQEVINDIRCNKRASYGFNDSKLKQYCSIHKKINMVNLENNICKEVGCLQRALYGFSYDKIKIYCINHKTDYMINLNHKLCEYTDCINSASFNYPHHNKKYCYTHKLSGMINISRQLCIYEFGKNKCDNVAFYNFKEERKMLYCFSHKEKNMIYLKKNTCIYMENDKGCIKKAIFNYPNELNGIFCFLHKDNSMIDVENEKCLYEFDGNRCNFLPSFNFINEKKRLFCFQHKLNGMINLTKVLCIFENCCEKAIYNYENKDKPEFCFLHKSNEMVHKNHRICKTLMCGVDISLSKISNDYCNRCFSYLYPENLNSRNYRTKELTVVNYIKSFYTNEIICNKIIRGGNSVRRPNILIKNKDYYIIIEIDEHQHSNYICENKRIMEISLDLNHSNIVNIRFNPDEYYDINSNKIPSCWSYNNGTIFIQNQHEWNHRLNILKETLNYWLENSPSKMLETIKLFYNQN